MKLFFIFAYFIIFVFAKRDVCIMGAGASGMSAAVYLKDKNLDVAVIEIDDQVGGNCHTEYFVPNNPTINNNWYELGVVSYINTTFLQSRGYGNWNGYSSVDFVKRFIKEPLIPYLLPSGSFYVADFATKVVNPSPVDPTPPPEFFQALDRYKTVLSQYPWINTGDLPNTIPSELMVPFSEFVQTHQLEPMINVFFRPYVYNFRNKDMFQSPTYSVLFDSGQWVLELSANPDNGFYVKGGCNKLYREMAQYIGHENIYLNKKTVKVERKKNHVLLHMKDISSQTLEQNQLLQCEKLIVSFAPTLKNLYAFDLTNAEERLFKYVETFDLYPFSVKLSDSVDFVVTSNLNFSNPNYFLPSYPFVSQLLKFNKDTAAPATGYLLPPSKNSFLTSSQRKILIEKQVSDLEPLFTLSSVQKSIHHDLSPQFNLQGMQLNAVKQLSQLQGTSNTYWIGGVRNIDWSHALWYQSKVFTDTYFCEKK